MKLHHLKKGVVEGAKSHAEKIFWKKVKKIEKRYWQSIKSVVE